MKRAAEYQEKMTMRLLQHWAAIKHVSYRLHADIVLSTLKDIFPSLDNAELPQARKNYAASRVRRSKIDEIGHRIILGS